MYWDLGANGTVDSVNNDTSITVTYSLPGSYAICAWDMDNDKFLSLPDTERIFVKADYPYFGNKADTATYINVPCVLRDPAFPGASGVPVAQVFLVYCQRQQT